MNAEETMAQIAKWMDNNTGNNRVCPRIGEVHSYKTSRPGKKPPEYEWHMKHGSVSEETARLYDTGYLQEWFDDLTQQQLQKVQDCFAQQPESAKQAMKHTHYCDGPKRMEFVRIEILHNRLHWLWAAYKAVEGIKI